MGTKILLLGNHRHTIAVVRSLGRAGFHVILGRDEHRVFSQYSRYCAQTWAHPSLEEGEERFRSALKAFTDTHLDVGLVFPIGESMLTFMGRNAAYFPALKIVAPSFGTIFNCLDKQLSYKTAARAGIPVPLWKAARNVNELATVAEQVGYPCVVKPNRSDYFFFGKKAVVCRSGEDVRRDFQVWPEGNSSLIVQRYVDSARPNCHFRAVDGKLHEYFEHVVVRTDRLDDTGFEIEGISVPPTPLLRDYCAALIRTLDYDGVGCVQFLTDRATGESYFLEINPRLDATCALPCAVGVDFPHYAVERFLSHRLPEVSSTKTYPAGIRVHYLMGDLQGLVHGLRDRSVDTRAALRWIYRMGKSALAADVHLTFQWTDPLPTVRLYLNLLKAFRGTKSRQPATEKAALSGRLKKAS